jgi:hypothetical protein
LSNIRVTYSGLIGFTVGIVSVITGLIFTLIVTRQLTQAEFGTWGLIGTLISYVIFIEPVISYWTVREISRKELSGKTSIFTTSFVSVGAILVYIVISFFVGEQVGVSFEILLFSSLLIPMMFLNKTLNAINNASKPHATSYGLLAFETIKIPVGLVFVYFLQMGLEGAIIASLGAYIASNIVLAIYAKDHLKAKFNKEFPKKWLKLFWVPLYPGISAIILNLDVAIFSILTNSVLGIALFAAASTVTGLIAHSYLISKAIYPKLLGGGDRGFVQENMVRFLYFSIPLTAMAIVYARPALFALNPIYDIAAIIVPFMALKVFMVMFSGVLTAPILGVDKVDTNKKAVFKDYLKSSLFRLPTYRMIHNILYIGILVIGIIIAKQYTTSEVDLVLYWIIIAVVTHFPLTIIYYIMNKRRFTINLAHPSIIKYLLTSLGIFGFSYVLIDNFLIYHESIFDFLPELILYILVSVSLYLGITYFIDNKTKNLFVSIYNELLKKGNSK